MLGPLLRDRVKKYLFFIGKAIGKTGINPNLFSLMALLIAMCAAYFIYVQDYVLALCFIALSSFWDSIDGSVAKSQNRVTKFGNYLDAMLDKYVEVIIYFGFVVSGFAVESFLVIVGSLILSYAKPRTAIVVPIDNHDWPAIGERVDRLLLLVIGMAASIIYPAVEIMSYQMSTISLVLYFIAAIVLIGGVQRILYAKKIIEGR